MNAVAPLVSIVIPAYNERFFAETLESALAQQYPAIEVLVSDDSPGEAIRTVVERAADARVRYWRNPRRLGFAGNFTHGFGQARGEYVKFLNDDDRLHPHCVAGLAEVLLAYPTVSLAFSRRGVIGASGARRPDIPATVALSHIPAFFHGRDLGNLVLANSTNFIGEPTSALFRKRDLAVEGGSIFRWGGRDYHCLADLALWLRLLTRGLAYYTPAPWSDFRIHEAQEQERAMLTCVLERYWIACEARRAGYLRDPRLWAATLQAARLRALATDAAAAGEGAAGQLREMVAAIDADLSRTAAAEPRAVPL